MYDFLERDIDSQKLDELIGIIQQGDSVVFTGAGMSKPLGYRAWEEGIISIDDSRPGLVTLSGLTENDIKDLQLNEIIDKCKSKLGEKYFEFIEQEFGGTDKIKYHGNLFLIWKSNFRHFITTNFDPSLYDNREDNCANLVTYPSHDIEIQNQRTIYHMHSRAFITPFENEETLAYYLKCIVYGKSAYDEAYGDESEIEIFIYKLIKNYSVLFVGFSMNDEDFKSTFEKMRRKWNYAQNKINQHPLRVKQEVKKHFILLPFPQKVDYKTEEDYQDEVNKFARKETELSDINIFVIGYKKQNPIEHVGLNKALSQIKDRAPFNVLHALGELGIQQYGSGSASEKRF